MFFLIMPKAYPKTYVTFTHKNRKYKAMLRPIQKGDRVLLNQTYGSKDAMKYYMNGIVRPTNEIDRRFLRYIQWTQDPQCPWVHMLAFVGHKFVGSIMIEPETGQAEISYVLTPQFWNKGFGTYLTREVIHIVRPHLPKNVTKIVATARAEHIGSIKVLERNGFVKQKCITHVRSADVSYTAADDRLLYVKDLIS